MRYGPSQLGYSFPYCAGRTTSFKIRSASYISHGFTLELYLLMDLCLVANSRTWAYFKPILFASSLNCIRRREGLLISTGSIVSAPKTMDNMIFLVVEYCVVWYDQSISWISYSHRPLVSSRFFLSPLRITLFDDSALLLA